MTKTNENKDIDVDVDYELRPQTPEEKEKNENREIPEYKIKLDLSADQIKLLTEQVSLEFKAMQDERATLGLEDKWERADSQYDGDISTDVNIDFDLDVRESKIKSDAIVRSINEAFLPDDGDMIDVSPRPETSKKNGFEIAEKQQQFLDFAMDEEIRPHIPFMKIAKSSVNKFVGIGKLVWSYCQEIRRREESYAAEIEIVGQNPQTGEPIIDHVGLKRFLQTYPDAPKRYKTQVKQLLEGKDISIVVRYKECIRNNPELKYIKIKDFYVPNATEYAEGLKTAHCIVERKSYTYYELKKLEKEDEFSNVDALLNKSEDGAVVDNDKTKTYDVLEVTTYFKLNEEDDEETKIKCWFGEEKLAESGGFLGAIQYPYYAIDCDYIPFYTVLNDDGFYGGCKSVMDDVRSVHIAQNALLSLMLQGIYIRDTVTPIVKEGSTIEAQFLEKTFRTGTPLSVDALTDDVNKGVGFVQYPSMDIQGGLIIMEKAKRIGSDVSRVTDLITGGESKTDPNAPAQKTAMLLQQSGIGIRDYIRVFLPSFNIFASYLLQLYYQMNTEDRKYRIRQKGKQVTGQDVFADIKREEMIVKTNIQSRATAFAFDKANEKREALAAYQTVMADPYAAQIPMIKFKALKTLLSTFGTRWKTLADTDLPNPEQLNQQMQAVAAQTVQLLFQQAKMKEGVTGVRPNPREVISQAPEAIQRAQAATYDPRLAPEEEEKQ
jgi:hypothetical protein